MMGTKRKYFRVNILTIKEPFDYTKWQELLWEENTVNQVSEKAMEY